MTPFAALSRLLTARRAVAMIEFAVILPAVLLLTLAGAEMANYITTRMRISQLALWIADNAARMAANSQLTAKTITEADIYDVFQGARDQSRDLKLQQNGRVFLSSLEPTTSPNTAGTYKIAWQRCMGDKTNWPSQYGVAGDQNLPGIGPAGRKVTAQDSNATMFVEVYYVYKPLIFARYAPTLFFDEIASMAVRDRRDIEGGVKAGGTASTCS